VRGRVGGRGCFSTQLGAGQNASDADCQLARLVDPTEVPRKCSHSTSKGNPLVEGTPYGGADNQRKGTAMAKERVTKSLPGSRSHYGLFFAVHAATAQQTPSLPVPVGSTAHFVYFDTGAYALTPEDQDHIRDVAGMMQSTPAFVATIIGKADSVGSAELNEHLSQRRAEAVFEALVYTHKVPENRVRLHWTGERLPYISAADEQAAAQNRMVAIIVNNDPSRCQ
jgi:outer membrane protein OmpA-like peptidoglycan-associated protein